MTLDLSPDTVDAARDRDGAADDHRPDKIDDAIQTEQLGYGEGEPLGPCDSYTDYPSREELSNPAQGEFLRDLLAHRLVGGLDDAVDELTGANYKPHLSDWLTTVEAATDAHSLDVDTLLSKGEDEREQGDTDTLTSALGYKPHTDMIYRNNPVLIAELYCAGLSVAEVADTLDKRVDGNLREGSVLDTLKEVGLLEGKTRTEQREAFEDNNGRIGGTTISNTDSSGNDSASKGLTVTAEDFA